MLLLLRANLDSVCEIYHFVAGYSVPDNLTLEHFDVARSLSFAEV